MKTIGIVCKTLIMLCKDPIYGNHMHNDIDLMHNECTNTMHDFEN